MFGNLIIAAQETETVVVESANAPGTEEKSPKISEYEEVILHRLAVYEKLLSKTDPEDPKMIEWRTEMLADAKVELEHYRQNIAPLSASITYWFERSPVDSIVMYGWELENLSHDQVTNEKIRNLITNAIRSTR